MTSEEEEEEGSGSMESWKENIFNTFGLISVPITLQGEK